MKKKNFIVMFAFGSLVVSAMTALGIDHSRSVVVCHDVRLYMEGSFDAKVEMGGLTPHSDVTIYRLVNMKNTKLVTESVSVERRIVKGISGEVFYSPLLTFFIPDLKNDNSKPHSANLEANLPHEKVSASMICTSRS